MTDLQQISLDLEQATSRSLLVIDEFGKGTNESGAYPFPTCFLLPELASANPVLVDGIGLACGILEHLLILPDPPKVIAATHFHEIFENAFLPPSPRLQLGHMEVQVSDESREVEDQITYLYK